MRYAYIFSFLSVLSFVIGIYAFLSQWSRTYMPFRRRIVCFAIGVVAAAFFIQCAVGYKEDVPWSVYLSDCFINTMQMFSLDASYGEIVEHMSVLTSGSVFSAALTIYLCLLNVVASVTGGAIFLELLTSIFPSIKLFFYRRKRLYIFSDLNERSVVLAENIKSVQPDKCKPIILFTNVASDSGEAQGELRARANNLRAICLEDDILHCPDLYRNKKCSIFLMAETDESNLSTLSLLFSENSFIFWKNKLKKKVSSRQSSRNSMVFFFSDDEETVLTANSLKNRFNTFAAEQGYICDLSFRSVRIAQQTAWRQMLDMPLYLPLAGKSADASLHVVLFGNSASAKEIFKSVFWCGQMLCRENGQFSNRKLKITVVYEPLSPAAEQAEFYTYLQNELPELIPSCTPDDPLLRIYPDDPRTAPVYAELSFIETEFDKMNVESLLFEERQFAPGFCTGGSSVKLLNADYYFVMTGADKQNSDLVSKLKKSLERDILLNRTDRKQVICYEMLNNEISAALDVRYQNSPIKIQSFGSLKSRYSWENVVMDGIFLYHSEDIALSEGHSDSNAPNEEITGEIAYQKVSGITREIHQRYKVFSAGCGTGYDYKSKADYIVSVGKDPSLRNALQWLEHRRWCAFLRTLGYSSVSISKDRKYKNRELMLHPCLVEAAMETGSSPRKADLLDLVNEFRNPSVPGQSSERSVKDHDLPDGKFAPGFTYDEFVRWNREKGNAFEITDAQKNKYGYYIADTGKKP